jgi:hypothetical protein
VGITYLGADTQMLLTHNGDFGVCLNGWSLVDENETFSGRTHLVAVHIGRYMPHRYLRIHTIQNTCRLVEVLQQKQRQKEKSSSGDYFSTVYNKNKK